MRISDRAENIREPIVIVISKGTFGILKTREPSWRGYINEGPIPIVLIENQVGSKVRNQKVEKPIVVIVAAGHASSSPKGIGNSCLRGNIPELPSTSIPIKLVLLTA